MKREVVLVCAIVVGVYELVLRVLLPSIDVLRLVVRR